jgi:hypothetical protein
MSSRSERLGANRVTNPTSYFLEWKSKEKEFEYYDRVDKEKKRIPIPFSFVYLDERHAVSGYSDRYKTGIYSNEVDKYSLGKQPLTVKAGKDLLCIGIYKDIKADVDAHGGHYVRSIYGVAWLNGVNNEPSLVNIKLKGAATQAWGDFGGTSFKKFVSNEIVIATATDEKKGSVKFSRPVFTIGEPIENEEVIDKFDDILQTYFKGSGGVSNEEHNDQADAYVPVEEQTAVPAYVGEGEDDLPF